MKEGEVPLGSRGGEQENSEVVLGTVRNAGL